MCYYTNWAGYRPGDGHFSIEDIDPQLCTHIIYSFAKVQGNDLATTEGNDPGLLMNDIFRRIIIGFPIEMYKKIIALKEQNPDLKVMLAVGGWSHGSEPFTQMVATEESRNEFVENSLKVMKKIWLRWTRSR